MISFLFFLGTILYIASVSLLYSSFKSSQYFYPVGLLFAFVTNFIWLYIAKHSAGAVLYTRGLLWDSIIVAAYVLVPVLFFNIRLSLTSAVGCVIIVVGIIITKLG